MGHWLLIGAGFALLLLAGSGPRRNNNAGWHYLAPGLVDWLTLAGCLSLTALFLYVSGMHASDVGLGSQAPALWALIVGFGLGAVITVVTAFEAETRWNGEWVEQRSALFRTSRIRISEVVDYGSYPLVELAWCQSADGTRISFSQYASGADELALAIMGKRVRS